MEEKVKRFHVERLRWDYILVTPIFAVTIYIYFCARNIKELSYPFVLVSAMILFLFAVATYFAVYLVLRRGFTAMLFCFFCWIGCYSEAFIRKLSDNIQAAVYKIFGMPDYVRNVPNSFIILAIAILLTTFMCRVKRKETFTKMILWISLIILCMNGTSVLLSTFSRAQNDHGFKLKTEFVQNDKLESPNIYWIHPDGMLGFDAFEKYYGDSQEALMTKLSVQGFEISHSANFESSHSTSISIPILTSPHAYDTWISKYTVNHAEAMKMRNRNIVKRMSWLCQNAEFQKAFYETGYTVNVIGIYGYYYPADEGGIWLTNNDGNRVWKYGKKTGVILSIMRMLDNIAEINAYFAWFCDRAIPMIGNPIKYENVSEYRAYMPDEEAGAVILKAYQNVDRRYYQDVCGLYDILHGEYNSPRLTLIHNTITHTPFIFNEDGSTHEESRDPLDYYAQHVYGTKVVMGMVDMIIDADPNAIIIVQADHGLHENTEEDFVQAFGERADAVEIWNSTISAVRIPEQYRDGEEYYMMKSPLNITRYLVNHFVGRNYEYLLNK